MSNVKILLGVVVLWASIICTADRSGAAVFRYRQTGDWTLVTDGSGPGWGLNPNNNGSPGIGVPGMGDEARINFGNNTVTVSTAVDEVAEVKIGVDESGTVVVANNGVLSTSGQLRAGNNGNANGTLIVQNGGQVDIGGIFWVASGGATGVVEIESGATVTAGDHLWWGVTDTATIEISGTLNQTAGILGLGTSNASSPSGGEALVTILDGGSLNLNNISGNAALPSIQPDSFIDITGTGELTVPNNFVGVLTNYANAGRIGGNGVPGMANLTIDLTKNPGFTTAYVTPIPEPSSLLLLSVLSGAAIAWMRRK